MIFSLIFGAKKRLPTPFPEGQRLPSSDVNLDKELLKRWKKPGDMAKFKGISLTESTPISSRFVMKNHYMSLESIRIGYEIPERWLKKIRISGMSLSGYMNQICRISSIKDERGIDYPFARSVSFSLSVNL